MHHDQHFTRQIKEACLTGANGPTVADLMQAMQEAADKNGATLADLWLACHYISTTAEDHIAREVEAKRCQWQAAVERVMHGR